MERRDNADSELMVTMLHDGALHEGARAVEAAMGYRSTADVYRLALTIVPDMVLGDAVGRLRSVGDEVPADLSSVGRVDMLDAYPAPADARRAVVRLGAFDAGKMVVAAAWCGLAPEVFGYSATRLLVSLEQETPDFVARVKAAEAGADLVARRLSGAKDIQPWGEEDYRDYGLPDDDDGPECF